MKRALLDRGVLLALAALALYAWLAPAHVVDGDNAEFSGLAATGGIAHPSGYPLYLLWLHAMAWLPGSPAHAAGLATAVLGAAAVLVLHAACRAWGARPLAATAACALYAGAPLVLRYASEAEVFALNALVVAAVLWLAAREGPARGGRRALLLGLVAGLGLANNLTCVLVAPVGVLGIVRAVREGGARAALLAAGGLALGLAPYAYALVAADTPLSWGSVRSAGALVAMVARRDYGGGATFLTHGGDAAHGANLLALARTLGRAWLWLPVAAGAIELVRRCVRPARADWIALAASVVLAGPVLALAFDTPPEGVGLYIVQRFHLLPALLLAPAVACALDALAARVPERSRGVAGALVATLGLAAVAAPSLPYVARVHAPALEAYAENLLAALPPDSVVLATTDDVYLGTAYAQHVLGERPDVVVVAWPLMALDWYRERAAARGIVGEAIDAPASVQVATYVLHAHRPLFVEPGLPDVAHAFATYPFATLLRVVPRDAQPRLDEVVSENQRAFDAFRFDYARPGADDELPAVIHLRYAATWQALARALDSAGEHEAADAARAAAAQIGPAP